MKRWMVTAVALVLGLSVAPAAYASTVPDESAGAGATMQYVALDSMSVGPTVAPDTNSETAQETAAKAQDNADGSLSAPAGPYTNSLLLRSIRFLAFLFFLYLSLRFSILGLGLRYLICGLSASK